MQVDYALTGIDGEGNMIVDLRLSHARAIEILLQEIHSGRATINTSPELFGAPESPEAEDDVAVPERKPWTKKKNETKPANPDAPGRGNYPRTQKWEKKACCGSVGSRHFKTCPGVKVPAEKISTVRDPLTPDQYDAVKSAMHDREFQSSHYAKKNGLSGWEVNAAVQSMNYDSYIERRVG